MSILLPGNLSGPHSLRREDQKNELPLPDSWFPPECQPDIGEWTSGVGVNTKTNLATEGERKNITTSAPNPYASLELDQYGTELAKEARVWKVYVKETDAWDTELVEGWNRSLDVILIFAALFSAISTAFIIESTKGLQGDPTDIASQTLLQISQTLYAIANNSVPAQSSQSANETQEFVPSRPLLLVNILWYLSLSLSIATSFLAILAKDWCHSFMAHRSGHPCTQARRRQRKWTMIERWKMQELLAVLPLLIHIALLLFAIGLCIYVWELNVTVGLPIICVTGAVITFYATSTVAATLLDSFPYTTIVSRILGSELLKYLYVFVAVVAFCLTCVPIALLFYGLISVGERWEKLSSKHLQRWEKSFGNFGNDFIDWIGRVPWTRSSEAPCHDMVTSQALSWLIKHCEVPEAVDIALQAIAGANARLPRKPLEDCGASVALSRHIASGNLPKGQMVNEQYMSFYLRALSYLGANDSPGNTGEIEVMIWDLQAENERSVSALITDGKFTPEDHNIAALRIDSMAPAQCLSLLKSSDQDGKDVFDLIVPLLQQHADKTRTLHPASRLALVNAVTMLCACVPSSRVPDNFAGLSIRIFYNDPQYWGDDLDLGFRLIAIALLQGRPSDSDYLGMYSEATSLHAPHVFQMLLAHQLTDRRTLEQFIWFGVLEILSTPAQYNIDISQEIGYQRIMTEALGRTSSMLETLPLPINHDVAPRSATRIALPIIQSLDWIYTTSLVGVPDPNVYMFVVECMLCVRDNQIDKLCWSLMSTFCFPSLSMKLLKYLDERTLILVLQKHLDSDYAEMQFFAATQLWLLFTLYIDPPIETTPELDLAKFLVLLEQSSVLRNDKLNIHQAKEKLGERIEELEAEIDWEEGPPMIYGLRVLECVLQSRDRPLSDQRWERIDSELAKTPRRLRGLGSFTPLPMRQPYALDLLSKGEHISIPLDNERSELEKVTGT